MWFVTPYYHKTVIFALLFIYLLIKQRLTHRVSIEETNRRRFGATAYETESIVVYLILYCRFTTSWCICAVVEMSLLRRGVGGYR